MGYDKGASFLSSCPLLDIPSKEASLTFVPRRRRRLSFLVVVVAVQVLILSIALKTVAFILGCGYIFIDFRFLGKGMTLSEKARTKRELDIEDRDGSSSRVPFCPPSRSCSLSTDLLRLYFSADPLNARPVNLYVTKTALALLFGIVVSAWVSRTSFRSLARLSR